MTIKLHYIPILAEYEHIAYDLDVLIAYCGAPLMSVDQKEGLFDIPEDKRVLKMIRCFKKNLLEIGGLANYAPGGNRIVQAVLHQLTVWMGDNYDKW